MSSQTNNNSFETNKQGFAQDTSQFSTFEFDPKCTNRLQWHSQTVYFTPPPPVVNVAGIFGPLQEDMTYGTSPQQMVYPPPNFPALIQIPVPLNNFYGMHYQQNVPIPPNNQPTQPWPNVGLFYPTPEKPHAHNLPPPPGFEPINNNSETNIHPQTNYGQRSVNEQDAIYRSRNTIDTQTDQMELSFTAVHSVSVAFGDIYDTGNSCSGNKSDIIDGTSQHDFASVEGFPSIVALVPATNEAHVKITKSTISHEVVKPRNSTDVALEKNVSKGDQEKGQPQVDNATNVASGAKSSKTENVQCVQKQNSKKDFIVPSKKPEQSANGSLSKTPASSFVLPEGNECKSESKSQSPPANSTANLINQKEDSTENLKDIEKPVKISYSTAVLQGKQTNQQLSSLSTRRPYNQNLRMPPAQVKIARPTNSHESKKSRQTINSGPGKNASSDSKRQRPPQVDNDINVADGTESTMVENAQCAGNQNKEGNLIVPSKKLEQFAKGSPSKKPVSSHNSEFCAVPASNGCKAESRSHTPPAISATVATNKTNMGNSEKTSSRIVNVQGKHTTQSLPASTTQPLAGQEHKVTKSLIEVLTPMNPQGSDEPSIESAVVEKQKTSCSVEATLLMSAQNAVSIGQKQENVQQQERAVSPETGKKENAVISENKNSNPKTVENIKKLTKGQKKRQKKQQIKAEIEDIDAVLQEIENEEKVAAANKKPTKNIKMQNVRGKKTAQEVTEEIPTVRPDAKVCSQEVLDYMIAVSKLRLFAKAFRISGQPYQIFEEPTGFMLKIFDFSKKQPCKAWDCQTNIEVFDDYVSSRIRVYEGSLDPDEQELHLLFKSISTSKFQAIIEDILWLQRYSPHGSQNQFFDSQYGKMIKYVANEKTAGKYEFMYPTVSKINEKVSNQLDFAHCQHFKNYIRRSYEYRYHRIDVLDEMSDREKIIQHYYEDSLGSECEWNSDDSKNYLRARIGALGLSEQTEEVEQSEKFYNFLLEIDSDIVAVDILIVIAVEMENGDDFLLKLWFLD